MTQKLLKALLLALLPLYSTSAFAENTEREIFLMDNPDSTVQTQAVKPDSLMQVQALRPDSTVQTQPEKKDFKYWAKAIASRVKITAYMQGGYTAVFYPGNKSANTNTFDFKRAILMVGVDITKHFYAYFMHDFKSGDVQEYYLEYRPCKEINVRIGQSKKQLTIENPMSPTVVEGITMSQSVADLCGARYDNPSGREMGIMIYGDLFHDKLRYYLELLNGCRINQFDNNTQKDVVAKLEYRPIPNFLISASGQKGFANNTEGATIRSDRYAVGAEWKSKKDGSDYYKNRCAFVRAEVLGGRDGDNHSFGAYIAATVPVYKRFDVVGLVDYYNRDTDLGLKQTNLMAGAQYWFYKKCRLQAQYIYNIRSQQMALGNSHSIMAQLQVAF
ncbi:MAG: porin [Bacteroidaceae bacterium]|nr:porin [Bacteroidaceae bacterium]